MGATRAGELELRLGGQPLCCVQGRHVGDASMTCPVTRATGSTSSRTTATASTPSSSSGAASPPSVSKGRRALPAPGSFSDLSSRCGLASERDELRPERYPLLCYRSKDATERCSVCNLAATHEVAGCATADTFPLYLCKDCRSEYFFDAKGYLRPSMAGFSEWPLHQRPTLALGGDGGDEPETGPVLAEAVAE